MSFPITATFIDEITYDITPQNWKEPEWKKDFDNMKDVGIDTVVVMRSIFYDKRLYPSVFFRDKKCDYDDFLLLVLEEAEKRNMSVYLGLHIKDLTWGDGDFEYEVKMNKIFLDEVVPKYTNYKCFKGWYIPHEVGHENYNFTKTLLGLFPLLEEKTPNKKILISPFFRSPSLYPDYPPRLTPKETYDEWDKIFSDIGKYVDICAFQDGTCLLNELDAYMFEAKKVCDKYGIEFWGNVETFSRDYGTEFPPIDFEMLKKKISIESKYVSKMITFEFSHFLSPQSIYEKARKLNRVYKEYYLNEKL